MRTGQPAERVAPAVDDGGLAAWLRTGADDLCSVLTATAADASCWTFGPQPGEAGFWAQRQALETVVHRFDVEHAVGLVTPIPAQLAVDGISEVVDFLFPRQIALGRTKALPGRLGLKATDVTAQWSTGERGAEAEISGPAEALLLMLWKRPHAPVGRSGDAAVLAALDDAALTP